MEDETILRSISTICDRLSERTATLFLGAGINAGIVNDNDENFPLGQDLSDMISRDLLDAPGLGVSLDEAAEMARYKIGDKELNSYLFEKFESFKPGTAHLSLVQLPWDIIYTTNFDLLVEKANKMPSIQTAGNIRPVLSARSDVSDFEESDILYYKLHGSIDYANTEDGHLILSKNDYRHYDLNRKPLFKRLERDLVGRTFVFMGYSLRDSNFREILEDCRDVLGARTFPLSFAIRKGFSKVEEAFWRDKYNIQLLDTSADLFLNSIKETWAALDYSVIPLEDRKNTVYLQVDESTKFPKVAESFYQLVPAACTGQSNPELFFRGAEPSWADIREGIAPQRDKYWGLYEAVFAELTDANLPPSLFLITGAAGTGKTALIYTFAYSLARDFGLTVLLHISNTPIDARILATIVDDKNPKRIILIVRHAAGYIRSIERLISDAKQKKLPITIILEERKNQWASSYSNIKSKLSPVEFELGSLSRKEIDIILEALEKYNALGKLSNTPRHYQVEHFTALAEKDLLVALRELTTESSFDTIVRDEYNKIPSEIAKEAYVYVAALGQLDLAIRYEAIVHLLDLRYDQLRTEVFLPTEGVLILGEQTGRSRHNMGFRLWTRHPVIASIIFSTAAPDDDSKFKILNNLLTHLDPGFPEDQRLLQEIVRRRELVNTFASFEKRRAIYERLANIMPNNPYVLQHRSILERELNNSEQSVYFARKAVKMKQNDPILLNSLGLALEFQARNMQESLYKEALISEASKLFDDGIKNDPANPYGYIGKVYIQKQLMEKERDPENKKIIQANILSILEEAYEATEGSAIVATELAIQSRELGSYEDAIIIVDAGLKKKPNDIRLRDLRISLELNRGDPQSALTIAMESAKYDPTSWRIQRHIARIKKRLNEDAQSIKGHYEAAIRHHNSLPLMVELGAFLFKSGMTSEAKRVFDKIKGIPTGSQEKSQIRERWVNENGQDLIFSGKVSSTRGVIGYVIAIPENFEASFWRTDKELADLREGEWVSFSVGFNGHGAVAHIKKDK